MSGQFEIISQEPHELGSRYVVILKADDGYAEEQVYCGDESTLISAAQHFDSERIKMVADSNKGLEV